MGTLTGTHVEPILLYETLLLRLGQVGRSGSWLERQKLVHRLSGHARDMQDGLFIQMAHQAAGRQSRDRGGHRPPSTAGPSGKGNGHLLSFLCWWKDRVVDSRL